jgi:Mrp family chromosome partitioning ATPase
MEQEKNQVKQFAIVSGKGGTGKTTIAAAFAVLAESRGFESRTAHKGKNDQKSFLLGHYRTLSNRDI